MRERSFALLPGLLHTRPKKKPGFKLGFLCGEIVRYFANRSGTSVMRRCETWFTQSVLSACTAGRLDACAGAYVFA